MLLSVPFTDINKGNPYNVSVKTEIKSSSLQEVQTRILQLHGTFQKQLSFPHSTVLPFMCFWLIL